MENSSSEKAPTEAKTDVTQTVEQFSFDSLKPKVKPVYKVLFIVLLLACIGTSLYFSFNAVSLDTFEFSRNETGWTLDGFHNTGSYTSLTIENKFEHNGKEWCETEEKITCIKEFALCCDESITEIHIGASVTRIEEQAFYSCKNLRAVFVDENNPSYCSENGILYNKDKTEIILFPADYIHCKLNALKHIENGQEVMSFALPSSVKKVAPLCFAYVSDLIEVNLNNVEVLGDMALFKCSSLTKLDASENLTEIGADAFSYCKKLTYFFLPSSVQKIGHHAFYEDSSLDYIDIEESEEDFEKVDAGDYWHHETVTKKIPLRYNRKKGGN